jgi:hypothetical protein
MLIWKVKAILKPTPFIISLPKIRESLKLLIMPQNPSDLGVNNLS